MNQTLALIQTLKRQLRSQGKTYQDVAIHLDLSEVSIKRLFKDGQVTVARLESICDFIGLSLIQLMQLTNVEQTTIHCLSIEQEREIVEDLLLLLVTICIVNGYKFEEIINQYEISETDCIRKLAILDRIKIIELLPHNRIKLKVSANFSWLANGPIQQFFQQCVKDEFFQSKFNQTTERLQVTNGLLSVASNTEMQKKMQKLASEFVELNKSDAELAMEHKHGTTLVVAIRQWNSSLFKCLEKQ
ncbi:MAG: XRE family transcriptional regulator [Gammaproteobacteria bacterium]|nr:XRE family transcriptional regulator [Gammaproteobacteria bacterium]